MAREALAPWPDDALEVGRIGEAWGLKGGFHVLPYADPPEALLAASVWHLKPPEAARRPAAERGVLQYHSGRCQSQTAHRAQNPPHPIENPQRQRR